MTRFRDIKTLQKFANGVNWLPEGFGQPSACVQKVRQRPRQALRSSGNGVRVAPAAWRRLASERATYTSNRRQPSPLYPSRRLCASRKTLSEIFSWYWTAYWAMRARSANRRTANWAAAAPE